MLSFYFKYLVFGTFVLLASAGYFLRQAKTDYYLALFVVAVSSGIALFLRNKRISSLDLPWLICTSVSFTYAIYSLFLGSDLIVVIIQSLMFILPLASLSIRNLDFSNAFTSMEQWLIFFITLKILLFATQYSQVISAMTSTGSRQRFHDYVSLCLVFYITAALLYGYIPSKLGKLFLIISLFFFMITAAHRSLYIAVLIQIIYWFVGYKGVSINKKVHYLLLFLLMGGIFLGSSYGGALLGLFGDSIEGTDGNTNMRMELYGTVLSNTFDKFFGIGFGHYYLYGVTYFGDRVHYALHHNSYLSYLYYLGVIPTLIFLYFIGRLIVFTKPRSNNANFCKSVLLGMGFFAIFNVFFEQPIYGLLFWMTYGIFISENNKIK